MRILARQISRQPMRPLPIGVRGRTGPISTPPAPRASLQPTEAALVAVQHARVRAMFRARGR